MGEKLLLGDCREVMKSFLDESIDVVITSPPYDDLRTYGGTLEWNFEVFSEVAKEISRILKKGGVIIWVVGDSTQKGSESGNSFKQALFFKEECGLNIHDTMIYHKDNPPPVGGGNRYYSSFEYMFILSKGSPKTFNPITSPRRNKYNDKRTSRSKVMNREKDGSFKIKEISINNHVKLQNVWKYVVSGGNVSTDMEAHKHPAIFPERLALDHIRSWAGSGDVVLDPFMGSGTSGVACKFLGKDFIGIEKNKKYFELSEKRIGNTQQKHYLELL